MTKTIMGIDPGIDGAICILDQGLPKLWKMAEIPTGRDFHDLCSDFVVDHVCLEKVGCIQGARAGATWTFAQGFGRLCGWLEMVMVPFSLVPPKLWQKEMHVGTSASDDPKRKSLEAARRLFPLVELVPKGCRKPHDGWVDALLIAEYARRKVG